MKAVSSHEYLNLEKKDNVYEAWKNMFEKLQSKGKDLELDMILEYTKILDALNNNELSLLKKLYIYPKNPGVCFFLTDFTFNPKIFLPRLVDMNLLAISKTNGGPIVGTDYLSTITPAVINFKRDGTMDTYGDYSIKLLLNDKGLDFVNFMFSN